MKTIYIFIFLATIGCDYYEPIIQNEPEVVLRPKGVNWYAGACVNFATQKGVGVDFVNRFHGTSFGFWSEGKLIGSLYIGHEYKLDNEIEKQLWINGMKIDYYQGERGQYYVFHSGFGAKTRGSKLFGLYIKKGHESEMATTLSSIRRGSSRDIPLDDKSSGRRPVNPLPDETKSFVSKCNFRWDLGREYRDGIDWVAVLRKGWYDLGADWIPLEGEKEYPKVPERLKR